MKRIDRMFYRCPECLTIVAIEAEGAMRRLDCSACGCPAELMGRVEGRRLVIDTVEIPCDGRCTSARGPICDCHCLGENHGTNLLVAVTRDAGPVPTFTPMDVEAANLRRVEFEAASDVAVNAIVDRFGPVFKLKASGVFLTPPVYRRWVEGVGLNAAVRKARTMKTHPGRMKKINEIRQAAIDAAPVAVESRS